jgi:hypothetical protein
VKEKKKEEAETHRRSFVWAIIKREKKTGKVIRTIALDPDTEIPENITNFSEYIRDLIKQDVDRRNQAKAAIEKPETQQVVEEPMTFAELELYEWLDNWTYFHKYGFEKYGSVHEFLTLQPDRDTLLHLLSQLDTEIEKYQRQAEENGDKEKAERFRISRAVIEAVKKDRILWSKVYNKFYAHWREEHCQPEIYRKEAMWFEKKSWTGQDVLEKVLPEIDLSAPGKSENGHDISIKKIAEIFRVDYQTAYNKIVPRIEPILKEAAVKIG